MANTTGKKFGGRQKGTKNKVTTDVKELAAPYGPRALEVLAEIMNDEEAPRQYRIAASNSLMDRAYGKAPQHVQQQHQFEQTEMSDLEVARRIAFLFDQGIKQPQTIQ